MSTVTEVLIVADRPDDDALAHVNGWLAANDPLGQQFRPISLADAGGIKVHAGGVYAAALESVDTDGLATAIASAPWREPRAAMAYFRTEQDQQEGTAFFIAPALLGLGSVDRSGNDAEAAAPVDPG